MSFTGRGNLSTTMVSPHWWRTCGRRSFGQHRRHLTNLRLHCPNRSKRSRFEAGRRTSPRSLLSSGKCHMRVEPTPSCIAKCWPKSHIKAAGWSIPTTPRMSRPMQWAFWVTGGAKCFVVRGQRWVLRGRRTIGRHSRPQSWCPAHRHPQWTEKRLGRRPGYRWREHLWCKCRPPSSTEEIP